MTGGIFKINSQYQESKITKVKIPIRDIPKLLFYIVAIGFVITWEDLKEELNFKK